MAIDPLGKVLEEILLRKHSVVGQSPFSWGPSLSFKQGILDLKIGSGLDTLQVIMSFRGQPTSES